MTGRKSIAVFGFVNSLRHWFWLLILLVCFIVTVSAQSTADLLHQAAEAQLGPPRTAGEWITRMSPDEEEDLFRYLAIQQMREQAAQREAQKQKQLATQAAAQDAWNKSWQDAADHADENKDKALRYNIDLALKGDDYGEYRMGQRCRDGEDVPKDVKKAKDWFSKSSAHGSKLGTRELADLLKDFPELAVTNNVPAEITLPPAPISVSPTNSPPANASTNTPPTSSKSRWEIGSDE
jgi:hypothetical protein